jgi:hypothetical protein
VLASSLFHVFQRFSIFRCFLSVQADHQGTIRFHPSIHRGSIALLVPLVVMLPTVKVEEGNITWHLADLTTMKTLSKAMHAYFSPFVLNHFIPRETRKRNGFLTILSAHFSFF